MNKVKRKYLELILGVILLIPPILSVFALLLNYVGLDIIQPMLRGEGNTVSVEWVGYIYNSGGYTPALPFYFGLMAIGGAYLVSHSTIKTEIKQ